MATQHRRLTGAGAGIGLLALAACAASPTPPPPTISVPTPSASLPVATPDAPPAPEQEAPDAEDARRTACEERIAEADSGPFKTLEDCDALRVALVNIRNECEPSGSEVSRSFYESTECIRAVTEATFKKWSASLSAADHRRQEQAAKDFAAAQAELCNRRCGGDYYSSHCQVGMMSCYGHLVEQASKGELTLEEGTPERKQARALASFAGALCALPQSAWKGGNAPAKCVDRALAWLEACPGPDPADCTE